MEKLKPGEWIDVDYTDTEMRLACHLLTRKKPCILFDVDGTIADCSHRRHLVRNKPKNWPAFFKAQINDTPIEPVCTILRELYKEGKYEIVIFSARPDSYKDLTKEWLAKHNIDYHHLYMREAKDSRDDSITKLEMLTKLRQDGLEPIAVFDDRPKVVRMWREQGILVFPCVNQDEEF